MAKESSFADRVSRNTEKSRADVWSALLLKVVDAALAACIFVVPLLLGGRTAAGHFVLTLAAATAAAAWWFRQILLPRQYWRRSAAYVLLLAGILLVVMQTVPLPAGWAAALSPKTGELLPLWGAEGGLDSWQRVSLTPGESRIDLVLLLAYALVFWVTVQRIRSVEDVERLLRWTAVAAIGMALFGLLQYFTSNGKFFWVYKHPFADTSDGAKGAFTNRNHFAHFLALGIGPVMWWVQDAIRRRGLHKEVAFRTSAMKDRAASLDIGLRVAGLAVVFAALVMSLSRGGAIAAGVAALVSVAVCYRAGAVRGKFALGLAAVTLLLGAFLLTGDQESMGGRLEGLASGSLDEIDRGQGRRAIWKTTLAAIPDFLWFGAGAGSFAEVYPHYLEYRGGHTVYTHAENGYLQVTLETGLVGLTLVVLAILICGFWSGGGLMRSTSSRLFVAAGATLAPILASAIQSGVDFVWYAPGCLVVALILAACACRVYQFTRDEERRQRDRFVLPRVVAWMAAPAVVTLGLWMVVSQVGPLGAEPHWTMYRRVRRALYLNPPTVKEPKRLSFFPEDPAVVAERKEVANRKIRAEELEIEQEMLGELIEVVRWDPHHAEAHLALAGGYLRLFHFAQDKAVNRMPLSQIRDAAFSAGYSAPEELRRWLSVAIGKHCRYLDRALEHAKAAIALSPMLGEGYMYLAELCFLDDGSPDDIQSYVDQALRVRPYDGTVLFHAGREACLAGRTVEGLELWQKSFRAGPIYQRQVIDLIAGRTVASQLGSEIQGIIKDFKPDLAALKHMKARYEPIAEPGQMAPLYEALVKASQAQADVDMAEGRPDDAAERWLDAMSACIGLMRHRDAVACGRQAVQCDSHNFDARYRLGCLLFDMGLFAESEEHLQWCNRSNPGHVPVRRRLADVRRYLLDPEGSEIPRFGSFFPPGTDFEEVRLQVSGQNALTNEPFMGIYDDETEFQGFGRAGGQHRTGLGRHILNATPAEQGGNPRNVYNPRAGAAAPAGYLQYR